MTDKKQNKFNFNTIILVVILLVVMMNGCNTCNNSSAIKKNAKKLSTTIGIINKVDGTTVQSMELQDVLHLKQIKSIEDNAEIVLILEKEIDIQNIKSSGIKTLVNEYRK